MLDFNNINKYVLRKRDVFTEIPQVDLNIYLIEKLQH